MKKNALFFIFVLVLAGLNLGTIRRAEDPIRDTQTDPILYEQKKEEEKDGKKGALLHSVKYNPADSFLTASPNVSPKKEKFSAVGIQEAGPAGADWWEEVPVAETNLAGQKPVTPAGPVGTDWWEETPPSGKDAARNDVSAPQESVLGENLPEAQPAQGEAVPAEGSASDYWW